MTPRVDALTRKPERSSDARGQLDALLDEVPVGTLSAVVEGEPWSVPMLLARDGDRVLLHGSTGAGTLRFAERGVPVTLTVFAIDGLVLAWDAFESSANYRSAVLRGRLQRVAADESDAVLRTLTDKLMPGRTAEIPPSTKKELASTLVLALQVDPDSWLYKERTGGSAPPEDGGTTEAWTGVVPLRTVAGEPEPDDWNDSGAPVPPSVDALRGQYPA